MFSKFGLRIVFALVLTGILGGCSSTDRKLPKNLSNNPLLVKSDEVYGTYPWHKIKPEHFLPAIEFEFENAKKAFLEIAENPAEPNFENTIEAYEHFSEDLGRVFSAFYGVQGVLGDKISGELKQKVSIISSDFLAFVKNKKFFNRVQKIYNDRTKIGLQGEQKRIVELLYEDMQRDGLGKDQKILDEVNDINKKIGKLRTQFAENATKSRDSFWMLIKDKKRLAGLPENTVKTAANRAKEKGKKGYLLTLDNSVYFNILNFADDEKLRKTFMPLRRQVALGKGPMKGVDGSKYDNRPLAIEIAQLKHKKAKLLGYKNHAEWKLQDKMARSPENVTRFMDELLPLVKKQAQNDLKLIQKFKRTKTGSSKVNQWSFRYWRKKYEKERLGLDENEVKKYFPLDQVLVKGALYIGEYFWGLEFKERKNIPVYHEDVRVFEVLENGKPRALVYMDLFERKGKRTGAWAQGLRPRSKKDPVAILHLVTNLPKGVDGNPTLLTIRQAETVFHEMGHIYHHILSDTDYSSLAGTSVAWDFVEVPSQVPENFLLEKDVLDNFAYHYKTGKLIPKRLIDKFAEKKKFMVGVSELGQMAYGFIDMSWHIGNKLPTVKRFVDFDAKNSFKASLFPRPKEDTAVSASFGHIFAGGYDAGYYGYQWARVIGADLYAAFNENGEFSLAKAKPIAIRLRTEILSKGNSAHAGELFKNFRGREYKKDFFIKDLQKR